jgi:endonuclease/exonuclease/phosphatase family metal-dependent hydrolase
LPAALVALAAVLCAGGPALGQRTDLRVMSFNVRVGSANDGANSWDDRKALAVDVVDTFNPDILGLQEDLDYQGNFISNELPRYTKFAVGVEADGGGEHNAILYRTSRFTKVRSGTFWLSTTPNVPGSQSWGADFSRSVNWLELSDENNPGFNFVVMNTHWEHGDHGATARLNSATLMRQKMAQLAPGMPVMFTGDFNGDQGGAAYQRMTGRDDFDSERFLIDTYRNRHPEDSADVGTAHGFDGVAGDGRIDWILHDEDGFTTLDANIDRTHVGSRYPSDHFPINATLQPVVVPEPVGGLLAAGAAGALVLRRRSRTAPFCVRARGNYRASR